MLVHPFHGDPIAFFEIAATLIPVLLFGGVVAQRRGPSARDSHETTKQLATFIPMVGAIAIFGEVVAIIAIVTGDSDWWNRLIVALTLTLGMAAVVLAVWWPWFMAVKTKLPRESRGIALYGWMSLIVAVGGSVLVMTEGVGGAASTQKLEEQMRAFERSSDRLNGLRMRIQSNQEDLSDLSQKRKTAEARSEPLDLIKNFQRQEELLLKLLVFDFQEEARLLKENANLYRTSVGLPTLEEEIASQPRQSR